MLKSYKEDNTVYVLCEMACDESDVSMDIINESSTIDNNGNKVKIYTADNTLQSFNVENWNRRIYGDDIVMDSLDNDPMIQNDIKHGQWIGEWGHPLDTSPKRQLTMFPQTSSHRILKYWKEGNLLKGTVQNLPYGWGQAMALNAENNIPWSFSLRSLGSLDPVTRKVKKPLKVVTYDSVYRPSHIESYKEILNESASDIFVGDKNIENMTVDDIVQPLNESFNLSDITDYVKERSTNIQRMADMFKLDKFEGSLNETGNRMIVNVDKDTKISVPIESVINMQYSDILNSIK